MPMQLGRREDRVCTALVDLVHLERLALGSDELSVMSSSQLIHKLCLGSGMNHIYTCRRSHITPLDIFWSCTSAMRSLRDLSYS